MIFFKHRYLFRMGMWYKPILALPNSPYPIQKPAKALKFAIVITLINLLTVSAMAKAQQINLNLKNISLETVFNEIKKQTGYGFWYDKEDIASANKISVSLKNGSLKDALDQCLKNQPFTYEIFDKTIVVKKKIKQVENPELQKDIIIRGKVTDEKDIPIEGVTVKIKSTEKITATNDKGEFSIEVPDDNAVLQFNYIGFAPFEQKVKANEVLYVRLKEQAANLEEVTVVSTGYQTLPTERATGSFTVIDEKTISRSVSPDLLSRLKGVTNGLLFDNTVGNATGISVRGRSTIFSNTTPLIVVDNFPFEGDLNTLNPDIIESVTVLKDAAAASIWGVRAGNGVLVITTKRGLKNTAPTISFNANATLSERPDLYYEPQLSSSQYIDIERLLFDRGAYNTTLNNGFGAVSPVVALLHQIRLNPALAAAGNAEIDALRQLDVRDQLGRYFYRMGNMQHYAAQVSGGGTSHSYHFSAGYDKNMSSTVARDNERITLKGNNTYMLWKDRLKLNTDISFSKSATGNTNTYGYAPFVPYEQVASPDGSPLATVRRGGLSASYIETAGGGSLLDWNYRPLEELNNQTSVQNIGLVDYRINLGLELKLLPQLDFSLNYQYYNASTKSESIYDKDSFYIRNMVNSFSSINATTGAVTRPVPYGDIYSPSFANRSSNYGRGQLNFRQTWNGLHELTAIGGYELRDDLSTSNAYTVYGYSKVTGTSSIVDLLGQYPLYYNPASVSRIAAYTNQGLTVNRYVSLYGNAAYSYDQRYTLSLSYRKDASNLFGVRANQKGVPLWSAGAAWNIHHENFLNAGWLSSLQLKATYGYNGNVNNSISAYLTASPAFYNPYGILGLGIVNPPNDNLRWERVQNMNLGLYFSVLKDRINGSVEYYLKRGKDLIATSPIAPQTGISLFTGNTADTRTSGWDLQLNARIMPGNFRWDAVLIGNFVKDRISAYRAAAGTNANIVTATTNNLSPMVDYPINAVFGYPWAGLDATGSPQGWFNGSTSVDYAAIRNSSDRNQLQFFGSATPTMFGSLRQTFAYRSFELSFNMTYKLGHYFRRNSLNNASLFAGSYVQRDYDKRWQVPGDEQYTNVPALVYPNVGNRNDFYTYAGVLVERGDHIRLQDIQLNYTFAKRNYPRMPFSSLNIYVYANHLGLLWKANKQGIDPDVQTGFPNPRSIALGIRTNL